MTKAQPSKILTSDEKQYTVLPVETDPKNSLGKAMAAALKAKELAKGVRKSG